MRTLDRFIPTHIQPALADMEQNRILERIRDHDHTVWKPEPKEIVNRLGWLNCADTMRDRLGEIDSVGGGIRADGYTHALLLGMGGSSLAPEVFRRTFGVKPGYLDLAVLDSTDPGAVLKYATTLDPAKTLFIVSTKSGGTVETFSFFKYFYTWTVDRLGVDAAGRHFIAITDPGSKLAAMAGDLAFRKTFLNDPNIGGRFSALSCFGLVPAALIGMDTGHLLDRAAAMADHCETYTDNDTGMPTGAFLGAALGELARAGYDKATFILSPELAAFGDWVEQLIAESTGKEGVGILPVVHEAPGLPDLYGEDRLFICMTVEGDDSDCETIDALDAAGHPVLRIRLKNTYDLGGQFFLWELATAVAGSRLGINPFDQPDVESAKVQARRFVDTYMKEGHLPESESIPPDPDLIRSFLAHSEPGAYVSLQAYVPPDEEHFCALQELRHRLRDAYHLATTVGFGPRFLHSTGQLHKGDGGNGLFLQFICDTEQDASIPDEAGSPASSMTFGVLKAAQAMGDRQALLDAGRRVVTIDLRDDVAGGLKKLSDAL